MRVLFGISCIGRHCHQVTATRRALVVLFPLAPHVFDGGAIFIATMKMENPASRSQRGSGSRGSRIRLRRFPAMLVHSGRRSGQ